MQDLLFSLSEESNNAKTGRMAVSRTQRSSCPPTCPLAGNGCYAGTGHVALWWRKLDTVGLTFDQFLSRLRALPTTRMFRHNEAGDLPHRDGWIDFAALSAIARAVRHLRAKWSYTHHRLDIGNNAYFINETNKTGFVVNTSHQSLSEAAAAHLDDLPAVCVVPEGHKPFTHKGVRFIQCPATLPGSKVQCVDCGGLYGTPLCAQADRPFVITFPAHGVQKRKAAALTSS